LKYTTCYSAIPQRSPEYSHAPQKEVLGINWRGMR
jgi:hypothetical protein